MGQIGVIFEIEKDGLGVVDIFLNKKHIDKSRFVIFVDSDKIKGNYLIGKSRFKQDLCEFFYMDKFSDFSDMLVFDDSKFKFGKVCLAGTTFVDFEYLTFWFSAKDYRVIVELLTIDVFDSNLDSIIKSRIFDILKLMKL